MLCCYNVKNAAEQIDCRICARLISDGRGKRSIYESFIDKR